MFVEISNAQKCPQFGCFVRTSDQFWTNFRQQKIFCLKRSLFLPKSSEVSCSQLSSSPQMGTLEWLPLDREQRNLLFYGGIGLLLLLLGIFFCFEKNVFHKTRNAERLYLSLVMLIAYVWTLTTTISYESETVDGEGKSDFDLMAEKHPFLKLLPTTLEFTVVTLVATGALLNVVEVRMGRPYFDFHPTSTLPLSSTAPHPTSPK